jgi:hypothetical protein
LDTLTITPPFRNISRDGRPKQSMKMRKREVTNETLQRTRIFSHMLITKILTGLTNYDVFIKIDIIEFSYWKFLCMTIKDIFKI